MYTNNKIVKTMIAMLVLMMLALPMGALAAEGETLNIAALNGPTGIGVVQLIDNPAYSVELVGAPDQVVAMVASGQVDIAAVPTNLAATLYQKLDGGVQLLALNTLGVLYILEEGDSITSVADLAGKELMATGQGSMPEYVLNYILEQAGIADEVTVTYKAEHSELATLAASGDAPLVMLPEPHVTATLTKNPEMRIAIDMTQAFTEAAASAGEPEAQLSMGVMIVRKEVAEQRPEAIAQFFADYQASVDFVNADTDAAAELVAAHGILPSAGVAKQAIPNCHIVMVTGDTMKEQVSPLFQLLFDANPESVGGAVPDDAFYYVAP